MQPQETVRVICNVRAGNGESTVARQVYIGLLKAVVVTGPALQSVQVIKY